jgi:hypothetical protein
VGRAENIFFVAQRNEQQVWEVATKQYKKERHQRVSKPFVLLEPFHYLPPFQFHTSFGGLRNIFPLLFVGFMVAKFSIEVNDECHEFFLGIPHSRVMQIYRENCWSSM